MNGRKLVDLGRNPGNQYDWLLVEHISGKIVSMDEQKIKAVSLPYYLTLKNDYIMPFNDNVHNWLIKNQHLIPDKAIGFKICFLGSKFKKDNKPLIKILDFINGEWISDFVFINEIQNIQGRFIVPFFSFS